MTVSMMAEPVWCTHLLKFKCIFRAIQPFLAISVSFIQAELLNFISQKLHSQKRNDLFWSAIKAEKPELPNTKRHKKLLLWHHERWRWKRLDMSCEAHDKRKKEKKDRVFHLCRERMRGQRNPCCSTTVWNLLPQHHQNHCSQGHQWTIWTMCLFLNSPLHRQDCSSWGGGLQVCHRHHLHSWARGHPRRHKHSCRSRRRYLLGRKDPLQSAPCP